MNRSLYAFILFFGLANSCLAENGSDLTEEIAKSATLKIEAALVDSVTDAFLKTLRSAQLTPEEKACIRDVMMCVAIEDKMETEECRRLIEKSILNTEQREAQNKRLYERLQKKLKEISESL